MNMRSDMLEQERRARLAAERTYDLERQHWVETKRKFSEHAADLENQILEIRLVSAELKKENARLLANLEQVHETAKQRLTNVLDAMTDAYAIFDTDNRMITANAPYLEIFDGLEGVSPGVDVDTVFQAMVDEGIVNTEDHSPEEWLKHMTDWWMQSDGCAIDLKLWNNSAIRIVNTQTADGDLISVIQTISNGWGPKEEVDTDAEKPTPTFESDQSDHGVDTLEGETSSYVTQDVDEPTIEPTYVNSVSQTERSPRVMVIDHVGPSRMMTERNLETLGMDVVSCQSVAAALNYFSSDEAHVDLILAEYDLPAMDSRTLVQQSKVHGHVVPVILLSMSMKRNDRLVDESGLMIAAKPASLPELTDLLQTVLAFEPREQIEDQQGNDAPQHPFPFQQNNSKIPLVLAIEESKIDQLIFQRLLIEQDVEVKCAANSEDALNYCRQVLPDILFINAKIPRLDTLSIIRELRAVADTCAVNMRIIVTSDTMTDASTFGDCDAIIPRPLRKTDLVSELDVLAENARENAQHTTLFLKDAI